MHFLNFLNDYLRTNKKAFQIFKWTANLFVFVGAASIALLPTFSQQPWPFLLCAIGSTIWTWAAIIMKDRTLVAFNLFFVFIQTGAIFLRLNN